MLLAAPLLAWLAFHPAATAGGPDEFGLRLAALSSERAGERDAAERWLGAHIRAERFSELAAAARDGDAEVRLRLARVLGADERHLEVALRFLGESDPALSTIGREAVHASVVQFDPRLGTPAGRGRALEERLRTLAESGTPRLFRVDPGQPLERTLRALASLGDLPVGLVLDESIAERGLRRPGALLVGSWNEVLVRLAEAQGLTIEAHGGREGGAGSAADDPLFLRFTGQRAGSSPSGVDLVMGWLETVVRSKDAGARALAARNLVASGFLPAHDWLAALYGASADPAALDGLLLGAALGRVSPVLRDAQRIGTLIAGLSSEPEETAARVLQGLARLGCTTTAGTSVAAAVLDGLEAADARGRWQRLFLCGQLGCQEPAVERAALAVLTQTQAPPALRRRALATLAAVRAGGGVSAPPPLSESQRLELFRGLTDARDADRLARELALLGLEPPVRDPQSSDVLNAPLRRALLQAWLRAAQAVPAAAHLRALVSAFADDASLDELARELSAMRLEGDEDLLLEVVRLARAPGSGPQLDRLALLMGALPAADLLRWAECEPGLATAEDPVRLGALAACFPGPAMPGEGAALEALRSTARAALLERAAAVGAESLSPAAGEALLAGLLRAHQGYLEARRDEQARAFARAVQSAFLADPRSDLGRAFTSALAQPPGVPILDLEVDGLARFRPPAGL